MSLFQHERIVLLSCPLISIAAFTPSNHQAVAELQHGRMLQPGLQRGSSTQCCCHHYTLYIIHSLLCDNLFSSFTDRAAEYKSSWWFTCLQTPYTPYSMTYDPLNQITSINQNVGDCESVPPRKVPESTKHTITLHYTLCVVHIFTIN